MITSPASVKIHEWPAFSVWLNEGRIIYAVHKRRLRRSHNETKRTSQELKKIVNGKKVCMIADITNLSELPREKRNYFSEELPKSITLNVLVSSSALGQMLENLFLMLKIQSYPIKIFTGEKDAKNGLQHYL